MLLLGVCDVIADNGACPSDDGVYPGMKRENIIGASEGILFE